MTKKLYCFRMSKRARTVTTPFEYHNGLGRLYNNQHQLIRKVVFELNLEHSLSHEIEFETDKTEYFTIKSVEAFLSEQIDEEFFQQVKSNYLPDAFRSFDNCKGFCRGAVQYGNTLEGYTVNDQIISHGIFSSDKFTRHARSNRRSNFDYENSGGGLTLVLKCAHYSDNVNECGN